MPIAAIIALAKHHGPTLLGMAIRYGPTVVGLLKRYGPLLQAQVGPLIAASAKAGTLEEDVGAMVAKVQALAPLFREFSSLADLADTLGSVGGAPVESPAMERAAGSKAR